MIFGMTALGYLPNSVDLHGIYLNILFIFSGLHQICIGIEIAIMETKERVSSSISGS